LVVFSGKNPIKKVSGCGHCGQWCFEIVHDKRQVLVTLPLNLQRLLLAISLDSDANSLIQDSIENCTDTTCDVDSVGFGEFLNGFSQSVIVRNNFDQIESGIEPLNAVDFGCSFHWQHHQRFLLSRQECSGNIPQYSSDVTGRFRCIEISGCRNPL